MTRKELTKILCVEDDLNIQAILDVSLTNIGKFTVEACLNGTEALDAIDDFMPDLILSDVMMPETDGVTLLKKLRSNPAYDGIPLIFISARVQKNEVAEYLMFGAAGVINKPFDPLTLPEEIRAIWDKIKA